MELVRDKKSARDSSVQRGEKGVIRLCKLGQVAVRQMLWSFYPTRQCCHILIVGHEREFYDALCLDSVEKEKGLGQAVAVSLNLRYDPYKP